MQNTDSWTKKGAKHKYKKNQNYAKSRADKNEHKRQRTERLEKFDNGDLDVKETWKTHDIKLGNEKFDEYYWKQFEHIMSAEEFEMFKSTLIEKLPVTFRVNPAMPYHENIVQMFKDPEFVSRHSEK
jgi:16S rRNA C967 or C1407 C5-methylase (RsmB/RsmF family)